MDPDAAIIADLTKTLQDQWRDSETGEVTSATPMVMGPGSIPLVEPTTFGTEELPNLNYVRDVLVIPDDFDTKRLSAQALISLQLLDEMNKVIRVKTITKIAVITVN